MNQKTAGNPQMTLEITDKEREIAKKTKAEFKAIVKELDDAIRIVSDLKNSVIDQKPSREDLKGKYHGRLLRYRRKVRAAFNHFLEHTKVSLETAIGITDPEMLRLREILIAEIGELSDGVAALLDLLNDPDRDDFIKTLEQIAGQLKKRQQSITDTINNQLFGHLENDILGRIKISTIQRRMRILRQLGIK